MIFKRRFDGDKFFAVFIEILLTLRTIIVFRIAADGTGRFFGRDMSQRMSRRIGVVYRAFKYGFAVFGHVFIATRAVIMRDGTVFGTRMSDSADKVAEVGVIRSVFGGDYVDDFCHAVFFEILFAKRTMPVRDVARFGASCGIRGNIRQIVRSRIDRNRNFRQFISVFVEFLMTLDAFVVSNRPFRNARSRYGVVTSRNVSMSFSFSRTRGYAE